MRSVVRSYRDLIAWQKSMDLVIAVYRTTQVFPKEETYGLISQLRRAAVSVPSNIAEGHARLTSGEFRQFLGHSLGSLTEIETQILIALRLGYVDVTVSGRLIERTDEIGKVVRGLLQSISNNDSSLRKKPRLNGH
jgi:four helix bundle protein